MIFNFKTWSKKVLKRSLKKLDQLTNTQQFWLLFLFIIVGRFYPFFLGQTLVFGDNYSLMVPGKIFTAHWLKQGVLPLWNSGIFAGLPWLADINQSVLSPFTLMFVLFKPALALNLTVILHLFITYAGSYLVGKKLLCQQKSGQNQKLGHSAALLSALTWALSTQIAGSINNLSTLQSISWLPWLVWLGLNLKQGFKFKFFYALVVVLQFLGGYPQHVLYSILASVLLSLAVLFKPNKQLKIGNWFINWLVTGLLTIALSSFVWWPFVKVLFNSTRMQQTASQAMIGSLQPMMLLKVFLPYFFDKASWGVKWGPAWSGQPNVAFYLTWFGLLMLILTLLKQKNLTRLDKFLASFSVISLVFSLGEFLPGFVFLQKLLPLLRIGRYPSMIMFVTNFYLCLWLGLKLVKFERLELKPRFFKKLNIGLGAIFVLGLLGWALSYFGFAQLWLVANQVLAQKLANSAFHTLARDRLIWRMIMQNLLVVSLLTILALQAWKEKLKLGLLLILALELLYATQSMFFFAPANIYQFDAQPAAIPAQLGLEPDPQYRWLTRNSNKPYTDFGMYWEAMVVRAPFSDSFIDRAELENFKVLKQLKQGLTPNWNLVYGYNLIHGYTTLLPADFASQWQKSIDPRINFIDYIDLTDPQDKELLKKWAVKYYLVDNWFEIQESLADLKLVAQEKNWALYELGALSRFRDETGRAINLKNFQETPNQVKFEFNNPHQVKYLIMADRYDPGWRAFVNDQPVKIENYQGMRKIKIEPGFNRVHFNYGLSAIF